MPCLSQGHIEGKVMVAGDDGSAGTEILPGANVVWAGTTTGTSANAAGYFTLKRAGDTTFSWPALSAITVIPS
jgi:hypothetical protein